MKRTIFVFFLTLLFVYNSNAQYREVYYGAKVGGNLSHVMYNGNSDSFFNNNKMFLSSHIGGFAEIVINEIFAVQPELLYSVKGSNFDLVGENNPKSSFVFKYISIPILAKYYVSERISIQAGPQIAVLLSAKNEESSDVYQSNLGNELASVDIYHEMNFLDYGLTGGVSYLTKSGFLIGARYNYGLANTFNKDSNFIGKMNNGAVQIFAGFSFQ